MISTKEKHKLKEERIQKIERFGTRPKNKNFGNCTCRFCNAPNWTPIHKCPALEADGNKCGKKGQYAKACKQKFNNNRTVKRRTKNSEKKKRTNRTNQQAT